MHIERVGCAPRFPYRTTGAGALRAGFANPSSNLSLKGALHEDPTPP